MSGEGQRRWTILRQGWLAQGTGRFLPLELTGFSSRLVSFHRLDRESDPTDIDHSVFRTGFFESLEQSLEGSLRIFRALFGKLWSEPSPSSSFLARNKERN